MVVLTKEQKDKIESFIEDFKKYPKTESGVKEKNNRIEMHRLFSEYLNERTIDDLDENCYLYITRKMWASAAFRNRPNRVLQQYRLEKIKSELKLLLYGVNSVSERFDNFIENIDGFGPAYASEFLFWVKPEEYWVYNRRVRNFLEYLGIEVTENVDGNKYIEYCEVLDEVEKVLKDSGVFIKDYRDVDYFIYFVDSKSRT